MSTLRKYNTLLCLTVAVGLLAFTLADARPFLAAASVLGVLGGWYAGRAEQPWTLPRTLINLLVLAAIVNAALRALGPAGVRQDPLVSDLGEFLVYIQLLKLFDRRTIRDDTQVLTLSLFVVIAAILTSNALGVGVLLLVYTPLAIAAAMLVQIHTGQRSVSSPGERADEPPRVPAVAGRRSASHFSRLTWFAVLSSAAVAAVVFVLTPRGLGNDALGRFGVAESPQVGFTDQVKLNNSGFLNNNDSTPILDLVVTDGQDTNLGTPETTWYLRGAVHEVYDPESFSWEDHRPEPETGRSEGRGRRDRRPSFLKTDKIMEGARLMTPHQGRGNAFGVLRQHVTFRASPGAGGYVFTVWRPAALSPGQVTTVTWDPHDMSMRAAEASRSGFSYRVESHRADAGSFDPASEPSSRLGFQTGPIRDLAAQLLSEASIPLDPAERSDGQARQALFVLRDYLRTRYDYTLEMESAPPGTDPIEWFLFTRRAGHCEYFASAMTALAQSVGIHARIVTGFVATEFNRLTGAYLVRQSNAHAWVEAHTGEGRWATFDPSPPEDIQNIHRPSGGLLSTLQRWYDAIEFGWSKGFVNFDAAQQDRLFGTEQGVSTLGRRADSFSRRLLDRLRAAGGLELSVPPWVARYLFPIIFGTALILFALVRVRAPRLRRRRAAAIAARDPELATLLRAAGFYDRSLDLLERAGLAKPAHRPPAAHAAALAPSNTAAAAPLRAVSDLYYRLRFGRHPLSPDEAALAERQTDQLAAALSAPSIPQSR